jgi:diguanylate cyclase (GGDEF)-like protein/putative nucleotidyltransferase with HDIG domain
MSMGRVEDANRHVTQLSKLYMSTIETLAMAIDAKDQITHGHIRRVQTYAVALAKEVGVTDTSLIQAVEAAALLHDMGKLAVPEYILNKPGPLTPAEFDKMKLHATVGADILSAIDFPYPVVPIVRHHHENWNGTGYPSGLAGTDIPIGARILSVVDCFDALTSDRPYRPRLADKDAIRILTERRGSMYDPLVVDTFARVYTRIIPQSVPVDDNSSLAAITEASGSPMPLPQSNRSLDDIAASTDETLTLFDLARGLTPLITLQDIGDMIAKHLRRLIPCSLCVFFVYNVDSDELVAAHASGDNAELVTGLRIGLGQRLSGWVAANRQSIRNSDPVLDLGEVARAIVPRPRSCLSTPLSIDRELVGVLTLYSTSRDAFSDEHQRIIEAVSRQVSSIVKKVTDSASKDKPSPVRDPVTGLPLVEQMRHVTGALAEATLPEPTSLLLVDVDNLGAINRNHGRQAGDEVLARVVVTARGCLRPADLFFRHGSDEFIVLLLRTSLAAAQSIGERIHNAAKREQPGVVPRFGLTVVAVTMPDDGVSIDDLIQRASANLRQVRAQLLDRPPESIH